MRTLSFFRAAALWLVLLSVAGGLWASSSRTAWPPIFSEHEMIKQLVQWWSRFVSARPEDRVYVHIDKPVYRPGDTLWMQVYVRDGATMKPSTQSEIVHLEWVSPKGTVEKTWPLLVTEGTAAADLPIDEDAPGGLYTLRAFTQWQKNDDKSLRWERKIQLQQVVLPNLLLKLDFEREAYGPGDEVKVRLDLRGLDDQPLDRRALRIEGQLAGRSFLSSTAKTGPDGHADITFRLPDGLDTPDGLLQILLEHNGQTESISRSIPIVLNRLQVQFFPEGGDLIAGLPARVGFQVLNERDKPADAAGIITDSRGQEVGKWTSFHQGMGAFEFLPVAGETYTARVTRPVGVRQTFSLPEVLPQGYSLSVQTDGKTAEALVRSTRQAELHLIGQVRGQICYRQSVQVTAQGVVRLPIDLSACPMGVVQLTLFDQKGVERAERLFFAHREGGMQLSIKPDKAAYKPREKVRLTIRATDADGLPLRGNLSVAVVDDQLISFADNKDGHILSKLLLEPDLQGEVAEPNFYFDRKEAKAVQALDYLMMTRGWRRFTWEEVAKQAAFHPAFPAERRLISGRVLDEQSRPVIGIKVKTDKENRSAVTDKNGVYVFEGLALYEALQLTAEHNGRQAEIYVSEYGSQQDLHLYDRRYYLLEAAGAVEERVEFDAAPMAAPAAAPAPKDDAKQLAEGRPLRKNAVVPTKPMPQPVAVPAPVAAKPDASKEDKALELNEVVVIDPRMGRREKKKIMAPAVQAPQVRYVRARQFAAPVYARDEEPEQRSDFRQTIWWQPNVTLDRSGRAVIEFYNSDAVTTFRVVAEGIGSEGSVGHAETTYTTQAPFELRVKMPAELTLGDQPQIPVTIANRTTEELKGRLLLDLPAAVTPTTALKVVSMPTADGRRTYEMPLSLAANDVRTLFVPCLIGGQAGKDTLRIRFDSPSAQDAIVQPVRLSPRGFPVSIPLSGNELQQKFQTRISNMVPGSMQAIFTAYPSMSDELLAGIESILREPYGCFEQTSSSTYPNLLVLDYLRQADKPDKALEAKALALVEKGYKRLITFETPQKGYEWFGGAPGHEALTAYGLLEFSDMAKVYPAVSGEMVSRTADWLLARRDGKGGFLRDGQALDQFGRADDGITNAYIVWALAEAGYVREIQKELQAALDYARQTKDPYVLGLVANALHATKDARAAEYSHLLFALQAADGSWNGKKHSITVSTGVGLQVETTSLGLMALLRTSPVPHPKAELAAKWMVASRSAYGGFGGNTQSTVMALRALTAYAKYARRAPENGEIELHINGKTVKTLAFKAGDTGPISAALSPWFGEGEQKIEVRFKGCKQALPYTVAVNYYTSLPPSSEQCQVRLQSALAAGKVRMGETVRLSATLQNRSQNGQPMTMAIIGLPSGASAQPWQLKEQQEKGMFDYYELIGSNLVLYYRQMKPAETRSIFLDLKADIPGQYTAEASSAYLYYTAEAKHWQEGLRLQIEP